MTSQTTLTDAIRPQPIDRLGIVTLLSSLYFFQIWGLIEWSSTLPSAFHYAMMALSLLGVVVPRLWQILSLNAMVFVVYYVLHSPIASNNQTTAFFFALVVLAVYAVEMLRMSNTAQSREDRFRAIAGPARWLLAALYFYGIYHKINWDFLDPVASCAVVLYRTLAGHVSLQDFVPGHYTAIYITFIVEAIAMVALFVPRLKKFGMMIGLPFHIVIGFTGYAYYKDFSTIVLVLYALFLPKAAVEHGVARVASYLGGVARAASLGRIALIVFVAVYLITSGTVQDITNARPTHAHFVWFFGVYCFVYYAFVTLSISKMAVREGRFRLNWLYVVPLLFFINGFSPYVGLKTESSIAMFSNLHTEGGQTNHLIHGRLPGTFTYQETPVTILSSDNPALEDAYVQPGLAMVRYEFDKMLNRNPGINVTVDLGQGPVLVDETWQNTYLSASWIAKKTLLFKPIDYRRPKVCTH